MRPCATAATSGYLIVYKLDRFARDELTHFAALAELRAAGCQLVSVSENIDDTPQGMLLTGILTSINAFESRNTAKRVTDGLVQKARSGGTPTRAPLGYLNVQRWDGSNDIRTVEVDPDRAPLVQWAFGAYATGAYTLDTLLEELTDKGLRTRPSGKRASGVLSRSGLARLLRDPYYIGTVRYRGVEYHHGTHETFVPKELFARVQAVLDAHSRAGEKDRKHPHYLKGTLYCGRCGRRFLFCQARGNGGTYAYFMCGGRHNDKNGCTQRYVRAADAEEAVARYYAQTVKLPAERASRLRDDLVVAFRGVTEHRQRALDRHRKRAARLESERRKLLQLHYADRIDAALFGEEQARIGAELVAATREIDKASVQVHRAERGLDEALALALDAGRAYEIADDQTRRQWNQSIFAKLYLERDEVIGAELTDRYGALLADELASKLEAFAAERRKTPQQSPGNLRSWGSIEGLVVETAGIEPASAVARHQRLRAYPALWISLPPRLAGGVGGRQLHFGCPPFGGSGPPGARLLLIPVPSAAGERRAGASLRQKDLTKRARTRECPQLCFPGVLRGRPEPRLAARATEPTTSKPVVPVYVRPQSSPGGAGDRMQAGHQPRDSG